MSDIKKLEWRAEKIAVNLARSHIEALRQIWIEYHALRRGDKNAAEQAKHRRLDAEAEIQRLEAEFNHVYADLSLLFATLK